MKLAELRDVTKERKQRRRLAIMVAIVSKTDDTRSLGDTGQQVAIWSVISVTRQAVISAPPYGSLFS